MLFLKHICSGFDKSLRHVFRPMEKLTIDLTWKIVRNTMSTELPCNPIEQSGPQGVNSFGDVTVKNLTDI